MPTRYGRPEATSRTSPHRQPPLSWSTSLIGETLTAFADQALDLRLVGRVLLGMNRMRRLAERDDYDPALELVQLHRAHLDLLEPEAARLDDGRPRRPLPGQQDDPAG